MSGVFVCLFAYLAGLLLVRLSIAAFIAILAAFPLLSPFLLLGLLYRVRKKFIACPKGACQ